jgi:predicted molibdopterin-dependent oxidoreductase YjgC
VLYLIGEVPWGGRPEAETIIYQNIFPPVSLRDVDLILPSAAFSEIDGTFLSGEGRLQRVKKAVDAPGAALPDWEILCRVARKMGVQGFEFADVREVHDEISHLVKGFGEFDADDRKVIELVCEGKLDVANEPSGRSTRTAPLVLTATVDEHTYKGFLISDWVAGAKEIFAVGCVAVNPEDAAKLQLHDGDDVVVTSAAFERKWRARITADQPKGSLHVTLRPNERLGPNPHHVNMRKCDV